MSDASPIASAASGLVARLDVGDRRALPRLLTLVENRDPVGLAALALIYPRTGSAHVVGVTGPPGSGKSTLVAALVAALRAEGRRIAVVAIDPSSPITGGAVLGDRIRMTAHHADDGVFVRSMASRGRLGGLAPAAAAVVHVLDAAGFPIVLLETVGAGQDGIDIASLAHTVVVVQAPGLGDGVQAIKAGQLEIGDVLAVGKADLPGADELLRSLRFVPEGSHSPDGWTTPVLAVSATTGTGVPELVAAVDAHADHLRTGDGWTQRQRLAARREVLAGLRSALEHRLEHAAGDDGLSDLVDAVAARAVAPESAVAALLGLLDGPPPGRRPVGDQGGG